MNTCWRSAGKYVVDCVSTNGSIVLIIVAGCKVTAANGSFNAYRIVNLQIIVGASLKIIFGILI